MSRSPMLPRSRFSFSSPIEKVAAVWDSIFCSAGALIITPSARRELADLLSVPQRGDLALDLVDRAAESPRAAIGTVRCAAGAAAASLRYRNVLIRRRPKMEIACPACGLQADYVRQSIGGARLGTIVPRISLEPRRQTADSRTPAGRCLRRAEPTLDRGCPSPPDFDFGLPV
jgi:hypothetical protein